MTNRSNLQIASIIVIILTISTLLLFAGFLRSKMARGARSLEQKVLEEPTPVAPTSSQPITVSRENIQTSPAESEILKFSVFNPTGKDWIFIEAVSSPACGIDDDFVCMLDGSADCPTLDVAKNNDEDCAQIDDSKTICCKGSGCGDDGICLITSTCTGDPDCGPQEGVQLTLTCDNTVIKEKFQQKEREILAGQTQTYTALLEIKNDAPAGSYLCQITAFAEDEKIKRDVIIGIK